MSPRVGDRVKALRQRSRTREAHCAVSAQKSSRPVRSPPSRSLTASIGQPSGRPCSRRDLPCTTGPTGSRRRSRSRSPSSSTESRDRAPHPRSSHRPPAESTPLRPCRPCTHLVRSHRWRRLRWPRTLCRSRGDRSKSTRSDRSANRRTRNRVHRPTQACTRRAGCGSACRSNPRPGPPRRPRSKERWGRRRRSAPRPADRERPRSHRTASRLAQSSRRIEEREARSAPSPSRDSTRKCFAPTASSASAALPAVDTK